MLLIVHRGSTRTLLLLVGSSYLVPHFRPFRCAPAWIDLVCAGAVRADVVCLVVATAFPLEVPLAHVGFAARFQAYAVFPIRALTTIIRLFSPWCRYFITPRVAVSRRVRRANGLNRPGVKMSDCHFFPFVSITITPRAIFIASEY